MVRGSKSKTGQGHSLGRRGKYDRGQELGERSATQRKHGHGEDKRSNTSRLTSFSLRDEARNTERNHTWNSDRNLRHSQVNFVSAGSAEPQISKMPQAILPATAHESISHPSSPRSSLANMTIGGLDELSSDIPRLDQRGTDTPAVKLMQNSHHMDQNGRRSVHGLFFIDEVGSRVAVDKNLDPPKHPHAVSPLPSDSGEEVIVFEGRRRIAQNTLQHRPPLAGKSSRNSNRDYHFPRTNGQLNSSILGTTQTPSTGPAPPCQPQQPVQPDNIVSDYRYSNVHRGQPAKEKTSDSIKLSRTGWRKQRRSKKNARLAAKEDEILADYIEHMNDEAELDIAFSSLTQKGGLVDESSIDLESQAKTEGDATDIAAGLPPPGQYNRDLNVTRGIDEGFNFHASTDGESDKSVDEALIAADVQKCMDDIEDERDLLERKQARMTDEQVARLLSKQEELGFTSSELLLFDGDDGGDRDESSEEDDDAVIFRSAAAKRRRKAKMGQRQSSAHAFPFATDFAGMPEIDPYGDFDVMDRDRPSLKKTPNNRQNVPVFELSDIELEASLKLQWEKDRSRKKMRKKEREELHAQGLLGNKGQPDLKARYKEGISFAEVKHEVIEFMISDRQSLVLPPMANNERRSMHEVAHVLGLKSKSSGKGNARFPVLFKSGQLGVVDESAISQVESMFISRRFFPRRDVKGPKRASGLRPSRRNAGVTGGVSYMDGEIVGAAAPEIGEENRGRAMLEKMGWSKGTALGALNNKGMLQPVVHTVKTTKAGLG